MLFYARRMGELVLTLPLKEVGEQISKNRDKFGKNAGSMSTDLSWPGNNPPARARYKTAQTNARNQVRDDHHNRLLAQALAGRNPTFISPVARVKVL